MPNWIISLRGDRFDLEALAQAPSGMLKMELPQEGSELYLKCDSLDRETDANVVREKAEQIAKRLTGWCRLSLNSTASIQISGIHAIREDGTTDAFLFPETITSTIRKTAGFAVLRPDGTINAGKGIADDLQNVNALAEADPEIAKVLRLLAGPLDFGNLYKIYEVVKQRAGKKIQSRGWATANELIRFRRTAQQERHGVVNVPPPKVSMALGDATELIKRIVRRWLSDEMR